MATTAKSSTNVNAAPARPGPLRAAAERSTGALRLPSWGDNGLAIARS